MHNEKQDRVSKRERLERIMKSDSEGVEYANDVTLLTIHIFASCLLLNISSQHLP